MSTGGPAALVELLAARAAGTIVYRGREVASRYGETADEWLSLDAGAALVDFSFLSDIECTGEERVEFLQGQLSQDVAALGVGGGAASLALNAQGRVEAVLALYARDDAIDIVVDAADRVRARTRLEQFLVADDVEFEDVDERSRIGLVGPRAAEIAAAAGAPPAAGAWWSAAAELAGVPVLLRGRGDLRVPCIDIAVGARGDALAVWSELEERGARPAGAEAFEVLRVESGLALPGIDIDERRIAVEARLEWAIHFNKGCYVGQEVVERAVSRGRLNRELCLLGVDSAVAVGARVADGGERDVVTSVAQSPKLGSVALAYVPLDRSAAGAELVLDSDGAEVAARVLEWPRVRRLQGR